MKSFVEFTERFGNMMSRTFLTVLYFVVLGPFALVYKLFADPLRLARPKNGNWVDWQSQNNSLKAARKQD